MSKLYITPLENVQCSYIQEFTRNVDAERHVYEKIDRLSRLIVLGADEIAYMIRQAPKDSKRIKAFGILMANLAEISIEMNRAATEGLNELDKV